MAIQNPLGPRPGGNSSALDLSTQTVVKASPGTVYRVSVTTAGSTAGGIYDAATTGAATAATLIASVEAVGVYELVWPCANGIVFTPGTSMVASISFA